MLRIPNKYLWLVGAFLVGVLVVAGCDIFEKPEKPLLISPVTVEIYNGPQEGETIPIGGYVTFNWKAAGGVGGFVYIYQLSGVDPQPIETKDQGVTYRNLTVSGDYTFTVTARDAEGNSAKAERHFKVAENQLPVVTITGPRANPKYTAGADVFLSWTATDPDLFGRVVEYRWAKTEADANAGNYSPWSAATSATFTAPEAVGTYKFYVQAKDNAGGITTATFDYIISEPTIFWVDETIDGLGYNTGEAAFTFLDEFDWDKFYKYMLEGFAYVEWDISEKGYPTLADIPPSVEVIFWTGSDPYQNSWGWNEGWVYTYYHVTGNDKYGTTNFLAEFMDQSENHRMWIIGENWLEEISIYGPAVVDTTSSFEYRYLHLALDTTMIDVEDLFGAHAAIMKPYETLPDAAEYPSFVVDYVKGTKYGTGSWDLYVNNLVPGPGAERVYEAFDNYGNVLGGPGMSCVAIRWPSGGTNTRVFLQTFELYITSAERARQLAQKVLGKEMGQ